MSNKMKPRPNAEEGKELTKPSSDSFRNKSKKWRKTQIKTNSDLIIPDQISHLTISDPISVYKPRINIFQDGATRRLLEVSEDEQG